MGFLKTPAIPLGSTILVTGANGLVGSHVVDQSLSHGYKVRGAVRDLPKSKWLQEHFDAKYGPGLFELIKVDTFAGPYDDAVKGVSGVAHVAMINPTSPDPNDIITPTVNGNLSILKAATKEKSVKRFVLCSTAATLPNIPPNEEGTFTADMWNEDVVKKAWTPPHAPGKQLDVYAASKVEGEQALWRFIKEEKPGFVANSIITPFVLGQRISHEHQGHPSSTGLLLGFFHNRQLEMDTINNLSPLYYVNTADIARFHLLGLIHPDIANERVFAWAGGFHGNDVLALLRKEYPNKEFAEDVPRLSREEWIVPGRKKAEEYLKDLGRPGFVPFDECVRGVAEGVEL